MLMAQDEGRFGRINIASRCWAPPKIRPAVGSQIVREYIYAYSAVCPATGDLISLVLPYADTQCMNIFLEYISKTYVDYFIIMQADGAGWHKSKGLKIPENIRFVFQSAYSPQLNPTEHIWDEIREKFMNNKTFNSIKEVVNALSDGLNRLRMNVERIKTMTSFPHLNINL
ncbi:MAG: IS630 family transposase [Candidatus Gastranaerophilales bacterium]|nr:IS630 family transposase [Candidatus Gastranaerophilales bacterium]